MKKYKHIDTGLYVENVSIELVGKLKLAASTKEMFVFKEIKLTNDFSKAKRVKDVDTCELLESRGFESIEVVRPKEYVDGKVEQVKEVYSDVRYRYF